MHWPLLINFLAFQVGWFASVLSAAHGMPWIGGCVVGAVIALHLWSARAPRRELTLILLAALIGLVWDSAMMRAGWLSYSSGVLVPGFAPYWIVAMWMLFATTLNVALRWLHGRYALAAALGAVAGPLAYYGGQELGGVRLEDLQWALTALATGWAVATPALVWLAIRFDGFAPSLRPAAVADR